uniref:Uncharacterized protein n=1 Tax=Picea glauca TaxID=3330 RepID=A0A101LTM5_PICGL|nr:hypothetical protein ABT39_MTgene3629 [Picea glauca]
MYNQSNSAKSWNPFTSTIKKTSGNRSINELCKLNPYEFAYMALFQFFNCDMDFMRH